MMEAQWFKSIVTSPKKRTMLLLIIIGMLIAWVGICFVARQFSLFGVGLIGLNCADTCASGNYTNFNRQVHELNLLTASIVVGSLVVGALPPLIYGLRLWRARKRPEIAADNSQRRSTSSIIK